MQEPILTRFLFVLELTALGLSVVFCSLLFIQFFINMIGLLERALVRKPATPAGTPEAPGSADDPVHEGVTPEEAAVIAAAVAETLGAKARIHRIRLLQNEEQGGWARVGRLDIMRSHTPRKNRN